MKTDFLVIGAGIAGLRAAVTLAQHGEVMVVTKEALGESNTSYAQGGIAVAIAGEEDVHSHLHDTLAAGDGLVDAEAARILVEEGPERVGELLRWGTEFDRHAAGERRGELMVTREGAHSRSRILHAHGDATGAEIGRALLRHARTHPRICFREWTMLVDLAVGANGEVLGAHLLGPADTRSTVLARATLLASGGAGQVYSDTTNPAVATGDGIAAAWRAGAQLADMEFYQFHPTALSLPGVARFLLSEALRGEGAVLVNDQGERFMQRYHPLGELAPRDVVARAITHEGLGPNGEVRPVYLDMRHVAAAGLDTAARFPGISSFLAEHGLFMERDLLPVRPAAHYLMGGVETDLNGATTLPRLFAAGEVACTGVHGANRLASNSLLEGLVFGARAAEAMLGIGDWSAATPQPFPEHAKDEGPAVNELRSVMWREAGLLRDGAALHDAEHFLETFACSCETRASLERANLHAVATAIVRSALARTESRGAHFRSDFPARDDEHLQLHSRLRGSQPVEFVRRELHEDTEKHALHAR